MPIDEMEKTELKTLTLTLYNRPDYTKTVLDHLSVCDDIKNYHIWIFCEPTNQEVIKLANNFKPNDTTYTVVNPSKLGCNLNIFQALDFGFSVNNYHIHLEDDTVPGKDALLYFEWARHKFVNDESVYAVSGYMKRTVGLTEEQASQENKIAIKRKWFTPWGWSTWRNRWQEIRHSVLCEAHNPYSWDTTVHRLLKNRYEICPVIARTQNIGGANGTYCPGPDWHRANQYNENWIETSKKYTSDFIDLSQQIKPEEEN